MSASDSYKLCPNRGQIWTTCMGLMSTTKLNMSNSYLSVSNLYGHIWARWNPKSKCI